MMYLMTDLLTGYVVPASAGLAVDPGLKASRHSTSGGGIEDYFAAITAAASDAERVRIGEHYGIRVIPG
jgi:hypothetical protein